MRFAYADPPYPGCAGYYPEKTELDHAELVARLSVDYPDGWALSTSSVALREVLALCPPDVRVLAWVKPWAVFKPGVGVAYAWEPVLVRGGRKRTRQQPTVRDWVAEGITLKRGLVGVKPDAFCFWLFEVLNLQPEDTLDDLFPGSGAVTRAWQRFRGAALTLPNGTVQLALDHAS
jgi:hypothetical protein